MLKPLLIVTLAMISNALFADLPRAGVLKDLDIITSVVTDGMTLGNCKLRVGDFNDGSKNGLRFGVSKDNGIEDDFYFPRNDTFFYTSGSAFFNLPEARPEVGHAVLIADFAPANWKVHAAKFYTIFNYDFEAKKIIGAVFEKSITDYAIGDKVAHPPIICGDVGNYQGIEPHGNDPAKYFPATTVALQSKQSGQIEFSELVSLLPESIDKCSLKATPLPAAGTTLLEFDSPTKGTAKIIAKPLAARQVGDSQGAYIHVPAMGFSPEQDIAAIQVWDAQDSRTMGMGVINFQWAIFYYDYKAQKIIGAVVNTHTLNGKRNAYNVRTMRCGTVGSQFAKKKASN